ncbi:MAG: hypothetical protein Q9170_004139 [Blastenia crenularia]
MLYRSNIYLPFVPLVVLMLSSADATKLENALQYRQNVPVGTGVSASATSNSPTVASSITSAADSNPPSANSPGPASSTAAVTSMSSDQLQESSSPSAIPVPQSNSQAGSQVSTSISQGSTSAGVQPNTIPFSDSPTTVASKATQVQSKSVSIRTTKILTTSITVSGGITRTNVLTTSSVIPVSASTASSTSNPALDTSESSTSKSGLDSSQKRIIIGVVVGVGGAILLGGIAVVVWRIWGRKGRSNDDDNDLMGSHPGSSGREKRSSISGHSPFRSTLDQYHHHGGPPNTASNF